ncbi:MAG: phosphatidylglycerophosphatase A [Candidatus Bathyarchaeia archaeon]
MAARTRPYEMASTLFFVGRVPFLPGTLASILTCFVIFTFPVLCAQPIFPLLFAVSSIFVVEKARPRDKDPREIVIDECAGMFITMLWHTVTPLNLFFGLLSFRAFDILKPFPIKRLEAIRGGAGIVLDDVMAGIYGNMLLLLLGR